MDFLKIFASKQHIPWTADLEYWISARELEGKADPAWRTELGYLELCKDLGVFGYYSYDKFWCGTPHYDETLTVKTEKTRDRIETTWTTPVGTITRTEVLLHESASWACLKYPIADNDDLKVFEYMIEHRNMQSANTEDYHKRAKLFADYGGLPAIGMPRSPLSAFFYEWAGILNGVYLLMDEPERIRHIFLMMAAQEEPLLDALCAIRPPLVHFADNVSSDNMSGYFNEYFADVYEHRIGKLHAANIACAVHLDGVVKPIIKNLVSVGFDAIEAITPSPGGDQQIEDIRTLADNDNVILWGGVPGVMFSPPYTWTELKDHVRHVIECWKGTPFILGVADQVPADGDIALVRAISDFLLEEYA